MATKAQHQPAYEILRERGYSVPAAADALGENLSHLRNALNSRVPPCDRLRRTLPDLLDLPLEQLFTPDLLARQYGIRQMQGPGGTPRKMKKFGRRRPKTAR